MLLKIDFVYFFIKEQFLYFYKMSDSPGVYVYELFNLLVIIFDRYLSRPVYVALSQLRLGQDVFVKPGGTPNSFDLQDRDGNVLHCDAVDRRKLVCSNGVVYELGRLGWSEPVDINGKSCVLKHARMHGKNWEVAIAVDGKIEWGMSPLVNKSIAIRIEYFGAHAIVRTKHNVHCVVRGGRDGLTIQEGRLVWPGRMQQIIEAILNVRNESIMTINYWYDSRPQFIANGDTGHVYSTDSAREIMFVDDLAIVTPVDRTLPMRQVESVGNVGKFPTHKTFWCKKVGQIIPLACGRIAINTTGGLRNRLVITKHQFVEATTATSFDIMLDGVAHYISDDNEVMSGEGYYVTQPYWYDPEFGRHDFEYTGGGMLYLQIDARNVAFIISPDVKNIYGRQSLILRHRDDMSFILVTRDLEPIWGHLVNPTPLKTKPALCDFF